MYIYTYIHIHRLLECVIFPDIIMLFLRIIIVSLIQNAYRLPDIYLVVCDTYYGRVEYIYIKKREK